MEQGTRSRASERPVPPVPRSQLMQCSRAKRSVGWVEGSVHRWGGVVAAPAEREEGQQGCSAALDAGAGLWVLEPAEDSAHSACLEDDLHAVLGSQPTTGADACRCPRARRT